MNANEVNEVINNICEKIGIGIDQAKEFVPMLAKYKVTHCAMWAIIWLAVAAFMFACVATFVRKVKRYKSEEHDYYSYDPTSDYTVGGLMCLIVAILIFLLSLFYASLAIDWAVNPQVKAVEYILNMI